MVSLVRKWWYLVLVAGLILAFVGYKNLGPKDTSKTKSFAVKKTDLVETLVFSGGIDAQVKAKMVFQNTGKLSFIKVKEGDVVKKGAWLAGLDMGDFDQAVSSAWYKYLAADANAKQIEDSVKNNDSTESFTQKNTRVAAQTDRDIKYDSWLAAIRARNNAVLKSPINGVVYFVTSAQPGQFVTASNQVEIDIVDPETIIFTANADQTDLTKLKTGMTADITLDTYPDKPRKGTVNEIAFTPTAGETGTVYLVKLTLDTSSPDLKLRMGMTGDVSFPVRELTGVIAVPQSYVKTIKDERVVYKKVGGGSTKAKVTVGETLNGQTIVLSGLIEGETIYDQAL